MKRLLTISLVFLTIVSLLAGCSNASQSVLKKESAPQTSSSVGRTDSSGSLPSESKQPTTANGGSSPGQTTFATDRMIIYDATMSLTVRDTAESIDEISRIAKDAGGFVANSSSRYERDLQLATLTLKVPAIAYDDVMAQLRKASLRVKQEDSKSQDITEEYSDLQAQLRNYEATEAQYLELLKKAQTIDEVLKVQQRITETRGQIERTKGRISYLERRSDMATITVSLTPEPLEKSKISTWEPLQVAADAWEASLSFLSGVVNILISAFVFFWWLIILLILALIVLRNRLTHRKRSEVTS